MLAPICLFTYNRLAETKQTVAALQKNYLAKESELFVFSDGAKNAAGQEKIKAVRQFLKTIDGFKKIEIIESPKNKGLANSIIDGVTWVINKYNAVIVIEDDLITSPNFLDFMNQSLNYYKNNNKIFSVTGWSMDLKSLKNLQSDFYFGYRMASWGWGIWKDRWDEIQWEKEYFMSFTSNYKKQFLFRKGGYDMPGMLKDFLKGKNNSWAIRACYYQFENNLLTIFPTKSKIINIGFGQNATHTVGVNRFDQQLDDSLKRSFDFSNEISISKKITTEFKNKFSLFKRLKYKIRSLWFY